MVNKDKTETRAGERLQAGHKDLPTRNTLARLDSAFAGMLKGYSPEELAAIPHTPEEIKQAKIKLQNAIKNIKHNCAICQDFGFVHPWLDGKVDFTQFVPCQCARAEVEKKKKANLIAYCEIPEKGTLMTFENFKKSPLTKEAFDICLALAKGESEYNFITLMGHSNHGKTHLAIAICNYRLSHGQPAKYAYVPMLLDELRIGFKKDGDESYMSRYNTFLTVPILLLDDLGTENDTKWAQERLDMIIDYRLMHKLSTVVTTNLPTDKLPFRIANRLKRDGKIVIITGPEFEVKK
jgi:DNA replication protein DnaC